MENYFTELNNINVNSKKEKKNNLDYLSWPWAWGELKKVHPDATFTVYENADGWNYHTDGRTAWVKVGVTVNGIEHIEYLPVMDYKNKSIPLESITSFEVNKAIQRATVKAIARHGIGLYIYAGEDLPEEPQDTKPTKAKPPINGYPSRDEMLACAKEHYPGDLMAILTETFQIEKIEDATNEQLASVWNKYGKK